MSQMSLRLPESLHKAVKQLAEQLNSWPKRLTSSLRKRTADPSDSPLDSTF
jgi:hypothetical protein